MFLFVSGSLILTFDTVLIQFSVYTISLSILYYIYMYIYVCIMYTKVYLCILCIYKIPVLDVGCVWLYGG